MASSTDKPDPESGKEVPVSPKSKVSYHAPPRAKFQLVDVVLRVLLFSATLTSVVVMVTSRQTELVTVPGIPFPVPLQAKFSHSPAFIYFVAALSVAGLYALLTALASIAVIFKPVFPTVFLLHYALVDTVILGLVASATGTAGGVAYIGLKGNSHVRWGKVCPTYEKFCHHLGSSIALSLFASILLLVLVMLSTFTLYTRIPK